MNTEERGLYRRGRIWYIHYYVNGVRKREAIGTNKQLAREILAKRRVEVKEGTNFDIKKDKITIFDEILKDFMEYSKNNKRSYSRDELIAKHLLPLFGGKRLCEITPHLIEQYKNKRLEHDKRKPATVNRELTCLKTMFSWAIKGKKASVNPVKEVKFFKVNNTRIRYLQIDEIDKLIENCDGHTKPIVVVAVNTGMRRGEILNLQWKDIDFNEGIIFIEIAKNNERREIPMNSMIYDLLREQQTESKSKYVFCNKNGVPFGNVRKSYATALKKSGIQNFRFHDLRHTFASHLIMSGVDLTTVKELLGHKTINMTMRYAHLSPKHKKVAVEYLCSKLKSIGTKTTNRTVATATVTATVDKNEFSKKYDFVKNAL